jgi:xylulokinase
MINYPYVVKAKDTIYSFTGISTAGFCLRWFRDQYGKEEMKKQKITGVSAYKQLDQQAAKVAIGSDDLIFLPHMMVGERAPYWDEHIRGAYLGLTAYHTKAHMFRAMLEGVGYAMRYSIDAARDTGVGIKRATLVDGGASSPLWRQIIADTTEIEFQYIPDTLGAPMGDAILAGLGAGEITDHRVIEQWIGEKIATKPKSESVEKYRKHFSLYSEAVEMLATYFSKF